MSRIITFTIIVMLTAIRAYSQTGIMQVLQNVEQNNLELRAAYQSVISQTLDNKTNNILEDPSVSYVYLWDSDDSDVTCDELTIEQSFDFPSLYVARHKLNKMKAAALDHEAMALRQNILLQTQETCLDIILLRQQKNIYNQLYNNTVKLCDVYCKQMGYGESSILEVNKIHLELQNVKTAMAINEVELNGKFKELQMLNGNVPITFADSVYQQVTLPINYEIIKNKILDTDPILLSSNLNMEAAEKEISISRMQWLPQFAAGYRRTSDSGHPSNGFTVAMTIPIFANKYQNKIARANAKSIEFQREQILTMTETMFEQLYNEALILQESISNYDSIFENQGYRKNLKIALDKGQINLTDYFVELTESIQNQMDIIELENRFQKIMAEIFRWNL